MDQINFFKLQNLLKEFTNLLHSLFKLRWKKESKKDWEENQIFGNLLISDLDSSILKELKGKKIQMTQISQGRSSGWDVAIFSHIFSSSKFSDSCILKTVQAIKKVRNVISHDLSAISTNVYKEHSMKFFKAFEEFGKSKEEIEEIKTKLQHIEDNFSQKPKPENKEFEILKEKGNELFRAKKYENALAAYGSALEVPNISDDDKAILYNNRANAYYHLYLLEADENFLINGIKEAKSSILQGPTYFKAYFRLGSLYELKGKEEKALNFYSKSLSLSPNSEDIKIKAATLRDILSKKERNEHLISDFQPKTSEERIQEDIDFIKNNIGVNLNLKDAKNFREILEKEDPVLINLYIANDYKDGAANIKQDYSKAAAYYSKAASKGNAEAIYNLANLTCEGKGVKKDFKLAIQLYKQAAALPPKIKRFGIWLDNIGVASSQHALGLLYENGIYVQKDDYQAMQWFEKAANNGLSNSANNLGLMYLKGLGGPPDLEKAEQMLLKAHQGGDPNAKQNLVILYLEDKFPENALIWHNLCIKENYFGYLSFSEDNEKRINQLIDDFDKLRIPKWEEENGFGVDGLNQKKRFDRFSSKNGGPNKLIDNYCKEKLRQSHVSPKTNLALSERLKKIEKLGKEANAGSETAKTLLLSLGLCFEATNCLKNEKPLKYEKIITLISSSIQTEETGFIIALDDVESIRNIITDVLAKSEVSELNKKARICHIHINRENLEDNLLFIQQCLKDYPKEIFFHNAKGSTLSFLQNYAEANEALEKALKLEPENSETIYHKAVVLRLLGEIQESLALYKKFLSLVERDHRKYPESYYAMAGLLAKDKKIGEAKETFEKGLAAEKIQLAYYLPYKSTSKFYISQYFEMYSMVEDKEDKKKISISANKKNVIIDHRNLIKELCNMPSKIKSGITKQSVTVNAKLGQENHEQNQSFKQIYLNQIDTRKDQILNGYFLKITIIDSPCFGFESVGFIFQDNNEQAYPMSIYNFKIEQEEIENQFGTGTELQIFNPYWRIAADGKPRIRVDDPATVKIVKTSNKNCRVCLSEKSSKTCGKCQRSLYCSRDCQEYDWKFLSHKSICKS